MTTSRTYLVGFSIPRIFAKWLLWLQGWISGYYLVMCRGYNGDDMNFTELVWEDDRELSFLNKQDYPEFQIWIYHNRFGG